jgi:hypothetical protein
MLGQITVKPDVGETLLVDYYNDGEGGLVPLRRDEARPKQSQRKL